VEAVNVSQASLASQVLVSIRHAIIHGELAAGSLHSVARLAAGLGVSRSPVREALISLADQGMVAFERNRGVRILHTSAHDLAEVFSLRLLLEVPAAYLAAERLDTAGVGRLRAALGTMEDFVAAPTLARQIEIDADFHRVVLEASGNTRLTAFVGTLRDHQRVHGLSTAGRTRESKDIYEEHVAVYDHIAAGDAHGAAAALHRHLTNSARLLLTQETGDPTVEGLLDLPWLEVLGSPEPPARA